MLPAHGGCGRGARLFALSPHGNRHNRTQTNGNQGCKVPKFHGCFLYVTRSRCRHLQHQRVNVSCCEVSQLPRAGFARKPSGGGILPPCCGRAGQPQTWACCAMLPAKALVRFFQPVDARADHPVSAGKAAGPLTG